MPSPEFGSLSVKVFQGDNNPMNKISKLESSMRAQGLAETPITSLDVLAGDPGDQVGGRFISPDTAASLDANGNLVSEPTNALFTGAFQSGPGENFNGVDYQFGAVLAGVLGAGFNKLGQLLAGSGAVIIDKLGQAIKATGLFFSFDNLSETGGSELGSFELLPNKGLAISSFSVTNILVVPDPSFEVGGSDWTYTLGFGASTDQAHTGSYSLKMPGSSGGTATNAGFISVSGRSLLVSFWAYCGTSTPVNSAFVEILCYTSGGVLLGSANGVDVVGLPAPGKWVQFQIVGTYIATTAKIKLQFLTNTTTTYIDDVAAYDGNGFQISTGLSLGSPALVVEGGIRATRGITASNLSGTNTGDQNLSGYVDTTTNQNINGIKNFLANVGLNVASPTYQLQINGANVDQRIRSENSTAVGTSNNSGLDLVVNSSVQLRSALLIQASLNTTTDATRNSLVLFQANDAGTLVSSLAINGSNIGVGTNSPGLMAFKNSLTVNSAVNRGMLELSTSQADAGGTVVGDVGFFATAQSTNRIGGLLSILDAAGTANNRGGLLAFFTKPDAGTVTRRMTILSTGLVGINQATPTKQLQISGDLSLDTAGNGIYIKEGTNATMGRGTLIAGVALISTTKVTANSEIFVARRTATGTLGDLGEDSSVRVAGTSFTIKSMTLGVAGTVSVLDTSAFVWWIIEPA